MNKYNDINTSGSSVCNIKNIHPSSDKTMPASDTMEAIQAVSQALDDVRSLSFAIGRLLGPLRIENEQNETNLTEPIINGPTPLITEIRILEKRARDIETYLKHLINTTVI